MSFAAPVFVVLGLLVGLAFALVARRSERHSRAAALAYSELAFLERAVRGGFPWSAAIVAAWTLAIVTAGIALARPTVVANVPVRGGSVVLCIDTSGSMASADVAPSRAEAARAAAGAFIDGVPAGTRVALVAFSSAAIPLDALSDDRAAAHDALDRLPPPNGGTAIGDALVTAARLLPPAGRRGIVLVTDGVNNHGVDPLGAAQTIGAEGIAIFTVGIGTNGSGMLIPGTGESAVLDEDALRQIAAAGHGTYSRAADAAALRRTLDHLASASLRERRRIEIAFPLAVGAGVLALGAALTAVALGRFP